MATITAGLVKELREKTGVGMMECKKALTENEGDIEASIKWLRERGMAKAAKKAGRVAAEGTVQLTFSPDHKCASIVEFNCETDFAARNDSFLDFAKKLGDVALEGQHTTLDDLNAADFAGKTVDEALKELIATVGENMSIRRMEFVCLSNGGVFGYSHLGGKIGTLVAIEGVDPSDEKVRELGKEIAMHIAAAAPKYLNRDEVDQTDIDQEKEIAKTKLEAEGKPADLIDKILVGHVNKYFKEICLVDQPYTRDPKLTIEQLVKNTAPDAKIVSFTRFQLGEGIEKKQENFADEVAAQIKK